MERDCVCRYHSTPCDCEGQEQPDGKLTWWEVLMVMSFVAFVAWAGSVR